MARWRKSRSQSSDEPLTCPSCAARYSLDERFCTRCGMPLVYAGAKSESVRIGGLRDRARKIDPQYAGGELIRVAGARNQAEAELIQNLLLEEGVPSMLKRSSGFDVPDFLAAGPRDVLVPRDGAEAARGVLLREGLEPPADEDTGLSGTHALRLALLILAGALITALIAWILIKSAT
jgi:hypothetical protein